MRTYLGSLLAVAAVACGPDLRGNGNGTVDAKVEIDAAVGCLPQAESCRDGIDNDCDSRVDCGDPDCSGVDGCPVCGVVDVPEAQPLALPDGIGTNTNQCTTSAQCGPNVPDCVHNECHDAYTSTLNFIGFPPGAVLTDPGKLLKICVNMEHSWLRDLEMDLVTPDGRVFGLHKFVDRTGGEIFLGLANDGDTAANPVAGTGYQYCWKATAPTIMLNSPTVPMGPTNDQVLPAGDYASADPWAMLAGSPLNGPWTLRVTDLWSADNGFMFSWSIAFEPGLVEDCGGPIIQ